MIVHPWRDNESTVGSAGAGIRAALLTGPYIAAGNTGDQARPTGLQGQVSGGQGKLTV